MVLTLPAIEKNRYYSVQLVDLYTYNFGYLGTRTTGNAGGRFLVAGPGWKGETPKGVDKVIRADTEIALAIYRTQLFGDDDLANVKKIQAGYALQAALGVPRQAGAAARAEGPTSSADRQVALAADQTPLRVLQGPGLRRCGFAPPPAPRGHGPAGLGLREDRRGRSGEAVDLQRPAQARAQGGARPGHRRRLSERALACNEAVDQIGTGKVDGPAAWGRRSATRGRATKGDWL